MNITEAEIASVLSEDVDEFPRWASQLNDEQRADAYELAARIAFAPKTAPISKIKALSLQQSLYVSAAFARDMAEQNSKALIHEIETTCHAELQYLCARVLSSILAGCPTLSDESFDVAISLLKSLSKTAVFPHARDFLVSALSPEAALGRRREERMRNKRLPVYAFLGKLGTPHKEVSRQYARWLDLERVSFGEFIAAEATRLGLSGSKPELQRLGQELVDRDPEDLCRNVLGRALHWSPGLPIVVDGVRHIKVLDALRKLVAPCDVVFFKVEVEAEAMRELLRREFASDDEAEVAKKAATEKEVSERLWGQALVAARIANPDQVMRITIAA